MHRLRYLYLPSFRNKVTSTFNQFSLVLFQTADRAVNNTKLWKLRNRETLGHRLKIGFLSSLINIAPWNLLSFRKTICILSKTYFNQKGKFQSMAIWSHRGENPNSNCFLFASFVCGPGFFHIPASVLSLNPFLLVGKTFFEVTLMCVDMTCIAIPIDSQSMSLLFPVSPLLSWISCRAVCTPLNIWNINIQIILNILMHRRSSIFCGKFWFSPGEDY